MYTAESSDTERRDGGGGWRSGDGDGGHGRQRNGDGDGDEQGREAPRRAFAVTVAPLAPTAVGSIAAATLAEGATHMVTASDYFEPARG